MVLYKVCNLNDIKNDSMTLWRINSKEVIIAKHKQRIIAFDPLCPHRYAYLHKGWFNNNNIVCPLHEFEFDINTGKLVSVPERYNEQNNEWKRSDDIKFYNVIIKDNYIYIDI